MSNPGRRTDDGNSCFLVIAMRGGARRNRTDDLMLAKHALYQLSYGPLAGCDYSEASRVVGPGRFELPTSRLSGVRSNQLSYGPSTSLQTAPWAERGSSPRRTGARDLIARPVAR